ncbi:hypothetical protein C6H68_20225 [Photorhabdus luminescens]|nr:hypothetical protein C6H68_20225 [Photorhabdus luminescens]
MRKMDGIMTHNERNKPRYFQRGLSAVKQLWLLNLLNQRFNRTIISVAILQRNLITAKHLLTINFIMLWAI